MNKFYIHVCLLAVLLAFIVVTEATKGTSTGNEEKPVDSDTASLIRDSRATRVKRFGWGCCGCGCGCCGGFGGIGLFAFGK
uniref:Uncharacterized protein n=2 Tax=Meloidogyne TaxID=189290 RepID=A0A6V7U1G7_MELEN|nr:unnamed protein product [Meloidogyne enterolobii]